MFCPLQKLLQHPELSNSQLLADFLSPHSVESQFLDKMLPDVNLGTARACDRKWSDRLRASVTTRPTRRGNVGPTRPWAFEWRNVDDRDGGERKWQSHTSAEMKYLCFAGKIIKSVPSKLIKEVRKPPPLVCFACMCGFRGGSPPCQLDIFDHRAAKKFCRPPGTPPNPIFKFVILFTRDVGASPVLCFLCQKGQHLEPFIQYFFNSCESPKPKPSRPELTILSPTSENDKKVGPLSF